MKEVHKIKIDEFIKDSQELLTLEKKKVEIAGEVFKEERRRNREEVERLIKDTPNKAPNPNDGVAANAVAELSTRNAWNVLSSRMSSTIERAFTE